MTSWVILLMSVYLIHVFLFVRCDCFSRNPIKKSTAQELAWGALHGMHLLATKDADRRMREAPKSSVLGNAL